MFIGQFQRKFFIYLFLFVLINILIIFFSVQKATKAIDSPNKVTSGRQILTFALIGLALALVAKLLPSILRFFIIK